MTDTDKSTKGSSEPTHLFKPGQSGNPSGRPKGSKNKLTLLREAVLESAEEIVLSNFERIVQATVKLAEEGDPTALKIVWDRIIPSKRAIEDKKEGSDKLNITINVEAMSVKEVGGEPITTRVVEGEYTEVKEKDGI